MNKYLFILGFVGTALFTACSTADDLVAEDPNGTPPDETTKETTLIVEANQNSEIPITLGVGQSRGYTRAPIDPTNVDEETKFGNFSTEDGRYLGVFCLATGYQELYKDNPPIENNWTDDDDTGLIVRMKNVPAKVTINGTTHKSDVIFPNIPSLSTENPLVDVYYYPMGNWMKYNFYAYYPWQDEEENSKTLQFKNNRVLEKYYEIDGSQDILWGMADPTDATAVSTTAKDAAPYSSKYYRLKRKDVGEENIANFYPKLKFYHKLAQFRFFVKAADAATLAVIGPYNPETKKGMNMQVTDMYIGNAINRLELVVADQSGEYDGDLFWFGNYLATKALRIKTNGDDNDRFDQDGNGNLDNPLAITTDNIEEVMAGDPVGYIMLAPPSLPSFNATFSNNPPEEPETNKHIYQLYLKVKYDTAPGKPDPKPTTNVLALSLDPSVVGLEKFDEGKIYNIIVNVQSPEQISATAVLQEWQPGGTYQY